MANIVESILQLLGAVIVDCSQIWGHKAKRVPEEEFKLGIHFVYFRLYYLLHWQRYFKKDSHSLIRSIS